jgi:hypothetical protein
MAWSGSYEALREYLRRFTNIGGDPSYDTNGILMLLGALANNLRENASPEELRDLAETISPEKASLLGQLAAWARESHEPG